VIAAVVIAGFALNVLATVDFGFISAGGAEAGPAYVLLKLLERGAGAILVVVGLFAAISRSLPEADVDERPSPWVLYGILTGLGVFLLHNLVDFSLFEAGPMFLFALLAGASLGMREAKGMRAGLRATRIVAMAAPLAWLVAAVALAAPVLIAESNANAGEEAVRTSRFEQAAQAYQDAAATVPYNGEYSLRAATILASAQDAATVARARAAFDAAIRANPLSAAYYATRAHFESHQPQPDATRVRQDFERSLELDPDNVQSRLEFAKTLEDLHDAAGARDQYEKALWYDDQLAPDEIERLSGAKVAEIRATIARLGSAAAPATATAPATRPI
jgi:tetratricopeptide (TPR) repeat protein